MIQRWQRIQRELRGDFEVFRVYRDVRRSPRTGEDHIFHLIESPDWVNIIPITADGQIVMIEQFRHGANRLTLEIPGGLVDASDASPRDAARREMIEETGFDSAEITFIGRVSPNPAIQTNLCYSYVARGVSRVRAQTLDGAEDIAVRLVDPAYLPDLIADGSVGHALVIAAFYMYQQQRSGQSL